jgi:anaerobic magnesium-protoporphyrin IX monomethyl ester cyclase
MNIAIINLTQTLRTLGALNVSTFLREKGYPHTFVHFLTAPQAAVHHNPVSSEAATAALISFLESKRPDVVGISFMTLYFSTAQQLAARIKQALPSTLIALGGVHPTVAPEECLAFGDVVCLGEGEEPLFDLVRTLDHGLDPCKVNNLWVKQGSTVHKNELRHLCEDLDQRPFPTTDWENTFLLHDGAIVPLTQEVFNQHAPRQGTLYDIMASRGCPFSCRYCCNSIFNTMNRGLGKRLRFRSVDHIISELQYVKTTFPKVQIINFQDDAFGTARDDYVQTFCQAYKDKIGLPFHLRIIPTQAKINEDNLARFKEAGLMSVVMGLQGSDKMNREIYNRPTTQKSFIAAARMIKRHKLIGRYDVIIDNPYSTEEDEVEAIKTFNSIPKPYGLIVYSLAFFPFTELTKNAIRDGKYDPSSSGYETGYGSKKHLFPELARLIRMTPYTPSALIDLFLRIRGGVIGRAVISSYYHTVFRLERALIIRRAKRNARAILFARRVLLKVFQR